MAAGATPIEFDVGGEVYPVAFTTNALCSLEEEFGLSIASVGDAVASGKAGVRGARALFRGALLESHPGITAVQAGRLMEELGPDRAAEVVQQAFERLKAGLEQTVKLPSPDARGRVALEAVGLRLMLSFRMNAQAEMEAYFDLNPEGIMRRIETEDASVSDLRALFRAGLVDHSEVTFEEAGRIMDRIGIRLATEAVKLAFAASFPEKEPDDAVPDNRAGRRADAAARRHPTKRPVPGNGTGKRSTRSGVRKR